MHIILYNEPLLFVHGPPVFIKVIVTHEESTSVFVPNGEEYDEVEVLEEIGVQPVLKVNPTVLKAITYLRGGFQRDAYQPLQFVIGEETMKGTIEKVEGETVFIELFGEDTEIVAVEMASIEEILWRGQPFMEK